MKKLSQTWKQKRPRRESCLKRGLEEKNVENIGAEKKGVTSLLSQDWNMDSLNFESQCEMPGIKCKSHAEMVTADSEKCKSPILRDGKKCLRERISTPIDVRNDAHFYLSNNPVSPVFADGKIEMTGEALHVETDLNKGELNLKQDSANKCTKLIDSWGLPKCIVDKYKVAGINEIFEWQRDCLLTGKALAGGNLVYSAPTSAGKTLVAELLMLKRVLSTKRKAIYILPFVSVAREKMFHLQTIFKEAGVHVDGYMGAQVPAGGFAATDIAVCTIEKANSLVNRLMEEKKMSTLGMVVIDEMHMIGDGQRGYLLELMLSKIRFLQGSDSSQDSDSSSSVQVIGMSATLPNLGMLATWLNADLYITNYRPVPLVEMLKVGRTVFDSKMQKVSEVNSDDIVKGDEEHIIPLCLETIRDCHSVLIFCPTKQWCEKLAKNIADNLKQLLVKDKVDEADDINEGNSPTKCPTKDNRTGLLDASAISEVLEQLRRSPVGLEKTLADVVSFGVSFHHAGLTFDERDVIEGAFKRGAIRVLVATSTLSSGVNLPARRVILRTPMFHGKLVNALVYKQMTGRAGRKGVDTKGESILICKTNEKQKGLKLLRSHLEPVYSCLMGMEGEHELPGMKRALLEIIAAGVASTRADVKRYANCMYLKTCLAAKKDFDPNIAIQNTIQFLVENEFVRVMGDRKKQSQTSQDSVNQEETFRPSQLGSATLASALSPDEALVVFRELQKARRCFVLENELHIVYQVMPIYIQSQLPDLDWYHYFNLFEKLPPQYKRVGEIVGVEEAFFTRAIRGRIPTKTEEQRRKLAVHQRFYSALALLELVNEIPLRTVSRRYNINKGLLQSLQSSASTFAGMVTKFCEKLGWKSLELLIDQFQSRLSFGVTRELCDLVRISLLNGARARLLYNSGYHSVSAVVMASPNELTKLLENFAPFESNKNLQGESERELASKKRVRSFWVTGKDAMTEAEAAKLIVDEAKELVRKDLASLGVEISNVKFLCDNHENETDVKEKVNENVGMENRELPMRRMQFENETNRDMKRKSDNTEDLHSVLKRRSPLHERSKREEKQSIKADSTDRIEPGGYSSIVEQKNKENIPQTESLGLQNSDVWMQPQSGLQLKTAGLNENIKAKKLKQCNVDVKESLKNAAKCPEVFQEHALNNEIVDERDQEKNISTEKEVSKHSENGDNADSYINYDDEFQPCSLLQTQDFNASFNQIKNKPEDALLSSIGNTGLKTEHRTSFICKTETVSISKTLPREKNEVSCKYDAEGGGLKNAVKDRSLNSSNECSLVEENGSLILIDSKEDISLNESDNDKDITPELFSESLWDDFELEPTAMPRVGRISSVEEIINGCGGALVENGGEMEDVVRKDERMEDVIKERNEKRNKLKTRTETSIKSNRKVLKSKEKSSGGEKKLDNDVPETHNNSTNDIFHESFDSVHSEKQLNDGSFYLKLSESAVDLECGSPEILGTCLIQCNDSLTSYEAIHSNEVFDKVCKNDGDEAAIGAEAVNNCLAELNYQVIGKNAKQGCTNIHHKSDFDEGYSDIIMSGSDSFANALCDIGVDENSQHCNILTQFRDKEAVDIGTTNKITQDIDKDKFHSKDFHSDKQIVLEWLKEKAKGNVDEKEKNDRRLEKRQGAHTRVTNGRKGQGKFDPCEGNQVSGKKRRSSERLAKNILRLGQTEKFTIVDVTNSQEIFNMFIEEWRSKDAFSFSVARSSQTDLNHPGKSHPMSDISGVAVCIGGQTAYFVDFAQNASNVNSVHHDKVEAMVIMTMELIAREVNVVKKVVFDCKEHHKVLLTSFGLELKGRLNDPKVAAWLVDPSSKEMTLQELALRHLPHDWKDLVNRIGNSFDTGSVGLMTHTAASPRLRSTVEAVLIFKLMSVLELRLASEGLYSSFREVEMPLTVILAQMELNGFGFSTDQCEKLKETLRRRANTIESKARELARRSFAIHSPEDVAQVLFIELGLPPSGDPNTLVTPKRGRQTRRPRHLSTAKGILEKLRALHPLPGLILEWRKVNNALSTVVYPMQRAKQHCEALSMFRIHPRCQFHTVTGRVIIAEPCLQHVPKDFDFEVSDEIEVNVEDDKTARTSTPGKMRYGLRNAKELFKVRNTCSSSIQKPISMRSTFVPQTGNILIAADYSQLELRIITHLSRDKRLLSILNNDGDVFRMIAAETNQCPINLVTDQQRQTAKHICYGLIYGIGAKALAEKLKVSEEEANLFMEKFKNRFPGLREFTRRTIEFAKANGYVVTMGGRRRYFSTINSTSAQARGQAERQAVNTTVQGSAADLVKKAMINIDKRIADEFWLKDDYKCGESERKKCAMRHQNQISPMLVLQLHDELIYECCARDCKTFVAMLQEEMEQALKLEVRLPVKVKTGSSWGDLTEWQ